MSQAEYEAIRTRKSIRKYRMAPLDLSILFEIQKKLGDLIPLRDHIDYRIEIILEEKIRGLFSVQAPYYLCLYSATGEGYLENAGFLLQQMDLYLSAKGIGSCWLGMAKPPRELLKTADGLEFVIMLAFGLPDEPLHRRTSEEFKRKSIKEITDIENGEELLDSVRLAPSASNGQPWFFFGTIQEIIACRIKRNFMTSAVYERLNRVDMGIALCHLYLSGTCNGKQILFDFSPIQIPPGYIFATKVMIVD